MPSVPRELLSPATRIALRELAAEVAVRHIDNVWQSEQFAPATDPAALNLSERRAAFQALHSGRCDQVKSS